MGFKAYLHGPEVGLKRNGHNLRLFLRSYLILYVHGAADDTFKLASDPVAVGKVGDGRVTK